MGGAHARLHFLPRPWVGQGARREHLSLAERERDEGAPCGGEQVGGVLGRAGRFQNLLMPRVRA